jgi:hypothetical protein
MEIKAILKSFSYLYFSFSSLMINFIITPLFTFLLSNLFLAGQIDLQIGFIMLLVTPCTDWYLVSVHKVGYFMDRTLHLHTQMRFLRLSVYNVSTL